jgi:hypothetical protein
VIANWNWLRRHVVGIGNADISNVKAFGRVMELVGGMAAVNMFFEDVLNTQSPFPAPIRAYTEERERGGSKAKALLQSGLEMSQLSPMVGGLRFGSSPLGALVDYVTDVGKLVSTRPGPSKTFMSTKKIPGKVQEAIQLGARGAGLPGTSQGTKSIRAWSKGESLPGLLFSTKPKPKSTVRNLRGRIKYTKGIRY